MSDGNVRKRVIVIRHAQTIENECLIHLTEFFIDFLSLKRFLPKKSHFDALCHLLQFNANSGVSSHGMLQVTRLSLCCN
jgi:hypothetical protein